ncbi:MAG: hypothetical protein HRT61_21235 [Ekhidna sp.]|nr:hypothetical protein [Ekhidna sp.]
MNERLEKPELLDMAEKSFHTLVTTCDYAVWYTEDNGKWSEYGVFQDDPYGEDAKKCSELCLERLKDAMPYRQYRVVKMTETRKFQFV